VLLYGFGRLVGFPEGLRVAGNMSLDLVSVTIHDGGRGFWLNFGLCFCEEVML